MLRAVLEFIVILIISRIIWRTLGGLLEGLTNRSAPPQAPPPPATSSVAMVRDPVCGTFVLPNHAVSVSDGRRRVYFCSTTCRDAYQARTA
jgi:YHS domain-containing protein